MSHQTNLSESRLQSPNRNVSPPSSQYNTVLDRLVEIPETAKGTGRNTRDRKDESVSLNMKCLTSIGPNLKDPIERLPNDILIIVFSCLSFPEIMALQRVSRGWRHYIVTNPLLYRNVSFLNSKHQISLRTLRTIIALANDRIFSLEFSADTLMHLTPLAPIYPYLQRLIVEQKNGIMATIFNIAFQLAPGSFYDLPNLRIAIFKHGMLLNNEFITLLCMAPNLEEFTCRTALVMLEQLDLFDKTKECRLKLLRIEHYIERVQPGPRPSRLNRSPAILPFVPLLEKLVLGMDSLQVLDLTHNCKLRYLEILAASPVFSIIQRPPSLEVCLSVPKVKIPTDELILSTVHI
jgi:hypothetical protein